jgi:hypothetical protein
MLEAMVNFIYNPLRENAPRMGLTEARVTSVFVFIQHMLEFHVNFLTVIREPISIMPTFGKYCSFVQIYQDYLQKFDKILDVLATWRSMKFREFVRHRLGRKEVARVLGTSAGEAPTIDALPWFLYRPIDRVKEYYRFLKDLKNLPLPDDEDGGEIDKALAVFRPVYLQVKKSEVRLQQKTQLLEMQLRIHGDFAPIVTRDRCFLFCRTCQMLRKGIGSKYKEITIFMFNDLFLWSSHRMKYKGAYSLFETDLEIGVPDHKDDHDSLMQICRSSEKHKRFIVFPSDSQRDKVMNQIIRAYQACQDKLKKASAEQLETIARRQARDTKAEEFSETGRSELSFSASLSEFDASAYRSKKSKEMSISDGTHLSTAGHRAGKVSGSISSTMATDVEIDLKPAARSPLDDIDDSKDSLSMRAELKAEKRAKKKDGRELYIKQLETEKKELRGKVKRQEEEIDTLTKRLKAMGESLAHAQEQHSALKVKYSELESSRGHLRGPSYGSSPE